MPISEALALARFAHLLALSIVLGAALFPFYGLAKAGQDTYQRLTWLRPLLIGATVASWISGAVWYALLPPDTPFGSVWLFRLVLATALIAVTLSTRATGGRLEMSVVGAAVLLASIALTGNSGSNNGALAFQHRLSDAVHLVASGVWIGALVVFSRLVTLSVREERPDEMQTVHDALARFAGVGTAAVAILTLSGMTNPGFFRSSLDTAYGQLLLAKLGVFGAMLALAGANRFFLTPRLLGTLSGRGKLKAAITALRVSILIETALGVIVLAMVGWLGILPPPSFDPPRQFN
jgi:putative copper resistance protein D